MVYYVTDNNKKINEVKQNSKGKLEKEKEGEKQKRGRKGKPIGLAGVMSMILARTPYTNGYVFILADNAIEIKKTV